MTTPEGKLFRDAFPSWTPVWLSDRLEAGFTVGYRLLWSMIAPLDTLFDVLIQGLHAALLIGTPSALPVTGRARGVLRGKSDTDAEWAARQRLWLDRAREFGSAESIAIGLHEYLLGRPKVKVVNRAGRMITCDTDGTVTYEDIAFDWDSISNPERASHWWDEFVIVYTPEWALTGPTIGSPNAVRFTYGIGHFVPREDVDAVRQILAQTQSAHSYVRCIIWTYDPTLFDPGTPSSMPDGRWGQWSMDDPNLPPGSGSRIRSSRSLDCRYWEFP